MLQDLHSHTYYSFCGKDKPEVIIEKAIDAGLEMFGICDHNHGVGLARIDVAQYPQDIFHDDYFRLLERYFDHMTLLQEKYKDKIKLKRGIEITTGGGKRFNLPSSADVSYFDYCLVENLDAPKEDTITNNDIFAFAKRTGCITGIAHTNMFAFIERLGVDPYDYFSRMRDEGIFWEMNVSYDSIHNYRQHKYMLNFFEDEKQQDIVRRSGVRISVGFDGHRTEDYAPDRIKDYCRKLEQMGIKMQFEE